MTDDPKSTPLKRVHNIHDAIFRLAYGRPAHAASHLRTLLPEGLSRRIDWSSLTALPNTFVDPNFQARTTDLLCSVRLEDRDLLLYLLIEHQSSVDEGMALRLSGYAVRALEEYRRSHEKAPLPLLVPILLHHSKTGWTAARSLDEMYGAEPALIDLVRPYLLQLSFLVEDVSAETGGALRHKVGLTRFVRLVLFVLARARESADIEAELAAWGDMLDALAEDGPQGYEDAVVVLRYTAEVGRLDLERLMALFRGRPAEQAIMSTAKQLVDEGVALGVVKGQANTVLRLLTRKFGPLDQAQVERVATASSVELDAMTDRVLFATKLEEVLGPL